MSRRSRSRQPPTEKQTNEDDVKKNEVEVEKGRFKYVKTDEEDGLETYRMVPRR